MRLLTAMPRRRVRLTPDEFLQLMPEQKAAIKQARIVAPVLGQAGFGQIEVTYKTPRYFVAPDHE